VISVITYTIGFAIFGRRLRNCGTIHYACEAVIPYFKAFLTFFPLYEKRRKKQHTVVGLYGLALATDNIPPKGLIYGHNVAR